MRYRVLYADIPNAGDQLNVYILKNLFGLDIVHAESYLIADIVGIGSGLGVYQYKSNIKGKIYQRMFDKAVHHIWGTGFMYEEKKHEHHFCSNKMVFHAVRGKLSKERVERLMGSKLGDIPLSDGGILTSELFEKPVEKRYEIGIVPHFKEQKEPIFWEINEKIKGSHIIDLKGNPMEVYKEIGACEYVMSSSLHGLIIADSFGIPNLHICATDKLMGDGFKFRDYYSGYGLSDNSVNVYDHIPTANEIIDKYDIDINVVAEKKKQMRNCFPLIQRGVWNES